MALVRSDVDAGTRLLIIDFWTNADHTEPVPAAFVAGKFYRVSGGDVYSTTEGQEFAQSFADGGVTGVARMQR